MYKLRLFLLTFPALLSVAAAQNAAAIEWGIDRSPRIRFCTHWKTQYVDADVGEDHLTSTSTTWRDAAYTYAQLRSASTNSLVWAGELDENGCTPYFYLNSASTYKFRQATKAQRGQRRFYINPDSNGVGASYTWFNSYYTTGWGAMAGGTHSFYPSWFGPRTNIMPILGEILKRYDELAYPETWTYIRVDEATCGQYGGAFYSHYGNGYICLLEGAGQWGSIAQWKYIVAHEVGHRVHYTNGWESTGSYDLSASHEPNSPLCRCDSITYGSDSHCLHSLEYIPRAASEGFANFFAQAVFNNRDQTSCAYAYAKETFLYGSAPWAPYFPYRLATPPVPIDCSDAPRWMESHCDPGDANLGIERDWLTFFHSLWTESGSAAFEISEMLDVFDHIGQYNQEWHKQIEGVEDLWGYNSPKYFLYLGKGDEAGVDHFFPESWEM